MQVYLLYISFRNNYMNMRLLAITLIMLLFSCTNSKKEDLTPYLSKGRNITEITQQELLKNVSSAMTKGGSAYAIDYCNVKAMPLTDSISQNQQVSISRKSLKNRNPENKASGKEVTLLEFYEKQHLAKKEIGDTVLVINEKYTYFKPIKLGMDACLKCHGDPKTEIDSTTLSKLRKLYPEDHATGYQKGDLRGMWKVVL